MSEYTHIMVFMLWDGFLSITHINSFQLLINHFNIKPMDLLYHINIYCI